MDWSNCKQLLGTSKEYRENYNKIDWGHPKEEGVPESYVEVHCLYAEEPIEYVRLKLIESGLKLLSLKK